MSANQVVYGVAFDVAGAVKSAKTLRSKLEAEFRDIRVKVKYEAEGERPAGTARNDQLSETLNRDLQETLGRFVRLFDAQLRSTLARSAPVSGRGGSSSGGSDILRDVAGDLTRFKTNLGEATTALDKFTSRLATGRAPIEAAVAEQGQPSGKERIDPQLLSAIRALGQSRGLQSAVQGDLPADARATLSATLKADTDRLNRQLKETSSSFKNVDEVLDFLSVKSRELAVTEDDVADQLKQTAEVTAQEVRARRQLVEAERRETQESARGVEAERALNRARQNAREILSSFSRPQSAAVQQAREVVGRSSLQNTGALFASGLVDVVKEAPTAFDLGLVAGTRPASGQPQGAGEFAGRGDAQRETEFGQILQRLLGTVIKRAERVELGDRRGRIEDLEDRISRLTTRADPTDEDAANRIARLSAVLERHRDAFDKDTRRLEAALNRLGRNVQGFLAETRSEGDASDLASLQRLLAPIQKLVDLGGAGVSSELARRVRAGLPSAGAARITGGDIVTPGQAPVTPRGVRDLIDPRIEQELRDAGVVLSRAEEQFALGAKETAQTLIDNPDLFNVDALIEVARKEGGEAIGNLRVLFDVLDQLRPGALTGSIPASRRALLEQQGPAIAGGRAALEAYGEERAAPRILSNALNDAFRQISSIRFQSTGEELRPYLQQLTGPLTDIFNTLSFTLAGGKGVSPREVTPAQREAIEGFGRVAGELDTLVREFAEVRTDDLVLELERLGISMAEFRRMTEAQRTGIIRGVPLGNRAQDILGEFEQRTPSQERRFGPSLIQQMQRYRTQAFDRDSETDVGRLRDIADSQTRSTTSLRHTERELEQLQALRAQDAATQQRINKLQQKKTALEGHLEGLAEEENTILARQHQIRLATAGERAEAALRSTIPGVRVEGGRVLPPEPGLFDRLRRDVSRSSAATAVDTALGTEGASLSAAVEHAEQRLRRLREELRRLSDAPPLVTHRDISPLVRGQQLLPVADPQQQAQLGRGFVNPNALRQERISELRGKRDTGTSASRPGLIEEAQQQLLETQRLVSERLLQVIGVAGRGARGFPSLTEQDAARAGALRERATELGEGPGGRGRLRESGIIQEIQQLFNALTPAVRNLPQLARLGEIANQGFAAFPERNQQGRFTSGAEIATEIRNAIQPLISAAYEGPVRGQKGILDQGTQGQLAVTQAVQRLITAGQGGPQIQELINGLLNVLPNAFRQILEPAASGSDQFGEASRLARLVPPLEKLERALINLATVERFQGTDENLNRALGGVKRSIRGGSIDPTDSGEIGRRVEAAILRGYERVIQAQYGLTSEEAAQRVATETGVGGEEDDDLLVVQELRNLRAALETDAEPTHTPIDQQMLSALNELVECCKRMDQTLRGAFGGGAIGGGGGGGGRGGGPPASSPAGATGPDDPDLTPAAAQANQLAAAHQRVAASAETAGVRTESATRQMGRGFAQATQGVNTFASRFNANFGPSGFVSRTLNLMGVFISRHIAGALVFGTVFRLRQLAQEALQIEVDLVRVIDALDQIGKSSAGVRTALTVDSNRLGINLSDLASVAANLVGVFENVGEVTFATNVATQLQIISDGALNARESFRTLQAIQSAFEDELADDPRGLQRIADVATFLQNELSVNVEDTVEGVAAIAEQARLLNLELEETATFIALVARGTGQTGTAAGEQFGRVLGALSDPSTTGFLRTLRKDDGTVLFDQATLAARDFGDIILTLADNYDQLSKSQQAALAGALGGRRQARTLPALFAPGTELRGLIERTETESTGAAEQRIEELLKTASLQISRFSTLVENIAAQLLQTGLLDTFTQLLTLANEVLSSISSILSTINDWAEAMGPVGTTFRQILTTLGAVIIGMRLLAPLGQAFREQMSFGMIGGVGGFGAALAGGTQQPPQRPVIPVAGAGNLPLKDYQALLQRQALTHSAYIQQTAFASPLAVSQQPVVAPQTNVWREAFRQHQLRQNAFGQGPYPLIGGFPVSRAPVSAPLGEGVAAQRDALRLQRTTRGILSGGGLARLTSNLRVVGSWTSEIANLGKSFVAAHRPMLLMAAAMIAYSKVVEKTREAQEQANRLAASFGVELASSVNKANDQLDVERAAAGGKPPVDTLAAIGEGVEAYGGGVLGFVDATIIGGVQGLLPGLESRTTSQQKEIVAAGNDIYRNARDSLHEALADFDETGDTDALLAAREEFNSVLNRDVGAFLQDNPELTSFAQQRFLTYVDSIRREYNRAAEAALESGLGVDANLELSVDQVRGILGVVDLAEGFGPALQQYVVEQFLNLGIEDSQLTNLFAQLPDAQGDATELAEFRLLAVTRARELAELAVTEADDYAEIQKLREELIKASVDALKAFFDQKILQASEIAELDLFSGRTRSAVAQLRAAESALRQKLPYIARNSEEYFSAIDRITELQRQQVDALTNAVNQTLDLFGSLSGSELTGARATELAAERSLEDALKQPQLFGIEEIVARIKAVADANKTRLQAAIDAGEETPASAGRQARERNVELFEDYLRQQDAGTLVKFRDLLKEGVDPLRAIVEAQVGAQTSIQDNIASINTNIQSGLRNTVGALGTISRQLAGVLRVALTNDPRSSATRTPTQKLQDDRRNQQLLGSDAPKIPRTITPEELKLRDGGAGLTPAQQRTFPEDIRRLAEQAAEQSSGLLGAYFEPPDFTEAAEAEAENKAEQLRQAIAATQAARLRDPVRRAQRELTEAIRRVAYTRGRDAIEYQQALQQEIQARQALADALQQETLAGFARDLAQLQLRGDDVGGARLQLRQALQELEFARQQRLGRAATDQARAQITNARAALRDAALQDLQSELDFLQQMGELSTSELVERYQEILEEGRLEGVKLTEDQLRDIQLKIKNLMDQVRNEVAGGFNIPDEIRLPTAYQVRRSLGLENLSSQGTTDARQFNNTNNVENTFHQQIMTEAQMQQVTNAVITEMERSFSNGFSSSQSTPPIVNV